ncbi:Pimeloyl-ACP methyl ester carboxylesterase [Salinihabitans flavidus]|uniref:Pimeloyl-ACP methyl ester carboxylesterase n=1 Tax=Salinihabitans flavidus TaxID=569882 RepID=A0A1H8R7A9_9RHOB|nr:alpha/beta fold hydrolase [Salinihabitans flavidus]SEO62226.1 Pimeloyl-ACP methyl ester carboxylesterase [Salinihabitans flavidus]
MSEIVLVHGSCHGAWCWRDLVPRLEAMGHEVTAIDLPGHGADPTPPSDCTLEGCARAVADAIPEGAVVVAHSWGGYPATRAADLIPGRIGRLIYLCAYAPWDGYSLADMRRAAPRQPLMQAVMKAADGKSFMIDPEQTGDVFYHDCPPGTVAYANARLCPQAIGPQEEAITLGAGTAQVPKSYIRCTEDRTIPPEFQITMTESWPEKDVHEMHTGHSPFFADPDGLAALIDRISRASA